MWEVKHVVKKIKESTKMEVVYYDLKHTSFFLAPDTGAQFFIRYILCDDSFGITLQSFEYHFEDA